MKKLQKEQLVNVNGGTSEARCKRMLKRADAASGGVNPERYNRLMGKYRYKCSSTNEYVPA